MQEVEIKGLRQLYETLSTKIPRRMEGKVLQKALAAGTAETVKAARRNIGANGGPENRTGTLRRAIYAARGKTSTPTQEVRIVNVRRGKRYRKGKSNRDAYYARWVEYGHRERQGKDSVGPPKFIPPRPFMRPAFESTKNTSVDRIIEKLRVVLADAVARSRF